MPDLPGHWDLHNVGHLQRRSYARDLADTAPFIGREITCEEITFVAGSNFIDRTTTDHAFFTLLVASGHVLGGKTRTGIETPRIVDEMCSTKALASPEINFAKTVYLKVDFLNGARFDPRFDVELMDPSVALGARLMNAFYMHDVLK